MYTEYSMSTLCAQKPDVFRCVCYIRDQLSFFCEDTDYLLNIYGNCPSSHCLILKKYYGWDGGNLSLKFETYQKLSQIFFNQVSLCGECGVGGGWQCLHQLADTGPAAAGQNTLHAAPHHALPRGNQIEQSIGYPPTTNVHGPMHRIRILQKGRQRSSMQSG